MRHAAGYSREQTPTMAAMLFVLVLETVAMDLLLRRFGLPDPPRLVILALDASSALGVLGVMVSCARRPHTVSPDGLRLRYGRLFSLDVPAEIIASARIDRRYDEKRLVRLSDGELALAVSSQTNIVVDLREPMKVPRPRRPWTAVRPAETVRRVRFFADDPAAALRAVVALTTTTAGERAA
ncbi:hypothetical protein [Microbispora sp. GKU 823]|uniref:hypothetical protein n=1 Tax=Microbispora sp. GKU 823 TaxID=1652100 RepID=UPI0009A267E9|nr:hypothetical protein [Microbispora sp. GKU 823]OPG08175.1 hypothetical protein B1L11_28805 [Microbispora sp. GKU 823]